MTFYKLKSIENGKDIYINPNLIICYFYVNDKDDSDVNIIFNSGDYATVSKSDFENMLILEGIEQH